MRRIQTFSDPFYTMKTPLDGVQYQLSFAWNHRTNTWSFDLDQSDGTPIVHGVRVVLNTMLLLPYHYISSCPPGDIMCVSNTKDDSPPTLNDLADGARCSLIYLPILDLIAYSQGNFAPSSNG